MDCLFYLMCDENEEIPVTSDRVKTIIAMLTIISCMIPSELIKVVSTAFCYDKMTSYWMTLFLSHFSLLTLCIRTSYKMLHRMISQNLKTCTLHIAVFRACLTNSQHIWRILSYLLECEAVLTGPYSYKWCRSRTISSSQASWSATSTPISSTFRVYQSTRRTSVAHRSSRIRIHTAIRAPSTLVSAATLRASTSSRNDRRTIIETRAALTKTSANSAKEDRVDLVAMTPLKCMATTISIMTVWWRTNGAAICRSPLEREWCR